jgi:membrane associated rhomboid family serine protease
LKLPHLQPRIPEHRRRRWFNLPPISVTTVLIVLCVLTYVADRVSLRLYKPIIYVDGPELVAGPMSVVQAWGHFSAYYILELRQFWRYITFQFLHGSLMHIGFNMFVLYMFGPVVEDFLGRRKFLSFYLLCGIAGGMMYLLLWKLDLLSATKYTPLVGASAGIFGVLIAAARLAPREEVLVLGLIPAKLRTVAIGLLVFAMISLFNTEIMTGLMHVHLLTPELKKLLTSAGSNAGGEAAHLGGAIAGFLLMLDPRLLSVFEFPLPRERGTGL